MLPPSVRLQISDMLNQSCASTCLFATPRTLPPYPVTEYLYCHYYEIDSTFLLSVIFFNLFFLFKGNDEKEEEKKTGEVCPSANLALQVRLKTYEPLMQRG